LVSNLNPIAADTGLEPKALWRMSEKRD
jgi:hypothetical protein